MSISQGGISLCCHGKQPDANGFRWRFYTGPNIDWNDATFLAGQMPIEKLQEIQRMRLKAKTGDVPVSAPSRSLNPLIDISTAPNQREGEENAAGGTPDKPLKLRAPSAYLHFCMDKRGVVKESNPALTVPEIGSMMGKMWKALDDDTKAPYVQMHADAHRDLVAARLKLGATSDPRARGRPKGTKKALKAAAAAAGAGAGMGSGRARDETKRVPTAYMIFCNDKRPDFKTAYPTATFSELATKMREMWEGMDEKTRLPYVKIQKNMEESRRNPYYTAASGTAVKDTSAEELANKKALARNHKDLMDVIEGHEAQHRRDMGIIEALRVQVKELKDERRKDEKVIQKLTEKTIDLKRLKQLVGKRESRLEKGKERLVEKKEKEKETEAFRQKLKDLKDKMKKGDTAAVRLSMGHTAAAAGGGSSSSSSSSSSSASSSASPGLIRVPPNSNAPVNPDSRVQTKEGPQNGEGRWGFVKRAMLRYKELYGTYNPVNSFVCPWTDDWPEEMWNLSLGEIISSIRTGRSYLKRRNELEEMSFSYLAHLLPKYEREYDYDFVRGILVRYHELHGHIKPKSDEVCEGAQWADNMQGFRIGLVVPHIRSGRCWGDQRTDLESIGFVFPGAEVDTSLGGEKEWSKYDFPFLKRMLLHYSGLNGNMRVQRPFVVPATTAWPYDMHGVELGKLVEKIRGGLKKFKPHREELANMGLDFEKREVGDWEKVKTALAHYKTLHNDLEIDRAFVVASNTTDWPEVTWGMRLGLCVENIQRYNNYKKYRSVLEGMGMVYKCSEKEGEQEEAMEAPKEKEKRKHVSKKQQQSKDGEAAAAAVVV